MLAFPIRLPSLGPAPAGSGKYKATLTALHAKVETIKDSTYSVEMSLNFTAGAENYSSFFKQPFGVGKTAETFARVLKEYNEKAAKSFPYMARVPSVRFVLTEKGDAGQFVVNVPPWRICMWTVKCFGKLSELPVRTTTILGLSPSRGRPPPSWWMALTTTWEPRRASSEGG